MAYTGEIRMIAGNYAPEGWLFCEGQELLISNYQDLFQLIGTTYGGDGYDVFSLPDLRGRIPIGMGGGYDLGLNGGTETETLSIAQLPAHSHGFLAGNQIADQAMPSNNLLGVSSKAKVFFSNPPSAIMHNDSITGAGGSQPHENMQPFLCVNFIICMFGEYPFSN